MACGGEEPRLRLVGVFRRAFRARQLRIEAGQLFGALAHPPLQRGIGALQRLGRLDARGDVGEGDDEAAVGHVVRADFDHRAAMREALEEGFARRGIGGEPMPHEIEPIAVIVARQRLQDFFEADADLAHRRRQVENLAEMTVGDDEVKVPVEHRDALADMIERGLQDLAIVVERGVRVVEQLHRRLRRDGALAQHQGQHEARGGGADHRGDEMLGMAQQLEIGRRRGVELDAACQRKVLEGLLRARRSEILPDGDEQVVDGDRGAPHPEVRRDRRQLRRHEGVGLQPLDRSRLARQREADISQDVEREAPHHAVDQRRQVGAEQRLRPQRLDAERPWVSSVGSSSPESAKLGSSSV